MRTVKNNIASQIRIVLCLVGFEGLQVCAEPASDRDPARTSAKGCGSMQFTCTQILKIVERMFFS